MHSASGHPKQDVWLSLRRVYGPVRKDGARKKVCTEIHNGVRVAQEGNHT